MIARMADRMGVMRAGEMVEWGATEEVFASPRHAYTEALLSAHLKLRQGRDRAATRQRSSPRGTATG